MGNPDSKPPLYGRLKFSRLCKLSPGEGTTESQAEVCGDDTESKRALSGTDDLDNNCLNSSSSSSPESAFWLLGVFVKDSKEIALLGGMQWLKSSMDCKRCC